jgi:hypothetical protein
MCISGENDVEEFELQNNYKSHSTSLCLYRRLDIAPNAFSVIVAHDREIEP